MDNKDQVIQSLKLRLFDSQEHVQELTALLNHLCQLTSKRIGYEGDFQGLLKELEGSVGHDQ